MFDNQYYPEYSISGLISQDNIDTTEKSEFLRNFNCNFQDM
jgi:hypothetical protein